MVISKYSNQHSPDNLTWGGPSGLVSAWRQQSATIIVGFEQMTDYRRIFHEIVRGTSQVPYLVGAWQHQVGHEYGAEEYAHTYIDYVKHWNWEWVKVNPRAVYYAEAWGSRYDHHDYAGFVIPRKIRAAINTPGDVEKITEVEPTANPAFSEELAASKIIRKGLPDRALLQTIFSPLSVLLLLADLPMYPGDTYASAHDITVRQLIFDQPELAKKALENIAHSLAAYARQLVRPEDRGGAGFDGIFYAVTGTVSEDYFNRKQYREFSEPYDHIVVDGVHDENPDAVVLLHTCRAASHPDWFDWPEVDLLQWDQYLPGNPKADADFHAVPVAGANWASFVPGKDYSKIHEELEETVALRKGKPFLLSPSCTVPTPASDAALKILSDFRVADK